MSRNKSQFSAIFKPNQNETVASEALVPEAASQPAPIKGKYRNPDYTQTTVYLRRTVHRRVKTALTLVEKDQDFSELVEALLEQWLVAQDKALKI